MPMCKARRDPFGETLRPAIDALWAWSKQTRGADTQGACG
jgi:hypothetical protein